MKLKIENQEKIDEIKTDFIKEICKNGNPLDKLTKEKKDRTQFTD